MTCGVENPLVSYGALVLGYQKFVVFLEQKLFLTEYKHIDTK